MRVALITGVLVFQVALFYQYSRTEKVPQGKALEGFPSQLARWQIAQVGVVDAETQAVLQADDTLTRLYRNPQTGTTANLFVASFRSQRTGVAPHSPKNCLPGNGWTPLVDDRIQVQIPSRATPIEVNRYIIQRGESRTLVLYWFQSRDRAVASEFSAKFYTMRDAVLENRTDTALVRVMIPLSSDADAEAARKSAEEFVASLYVPLLQYLPA
jgi:EpsI family protein